MFAKANVLQWLAVTISLCVGLACPARAQVVGASLSGTVGDTSGAVLPNAKVAIENVATGVTRVITTDSVGLCEAPNLLPGNYQVTVTVEGFQALVDSGVVLTVGAQQVLNVKMQVGTISTKVQVNAEEPTVELASSDLGTLANSETVRELPLNGRSWTDLATLNPGVSSSTAAQDNLNGGSAEGSRGFGNEMSVTTQVRAEFFNVLNHANFHIPFTGFGNNINTNVINANGALNPSAGLVASTATTSRQIQFGLKIGW